MSIKWPNNFYTASSLEEEEYVLKRGNCGFPNCGDIEKVLHFCLPPKSRTNPKAYSRIEGWKWLHPATEGWSVLIHQDPEDDDIDGKEKQKRLFDLTSCKWDDCTCPVQRSGLMRLEAVYKYGGFYIDSDVEPRRPLNRLRNNHAVFVLQDEPFFYAPDYFFGAESRNEIILKAIERVMSLDMATAGPLGTGPENLTAVVKETREQYRQSGSEYKVTILPPQCFAPVNYTEKHLLTGLKVIGGETFGVHLWEHSWKGF